MSGQMISVAMETIGYFAGVCTAVCFLPQTLKTVRTKNVKDLSATSYTFYTMGILCWIAYGLYLGSLQMVASNVVSLAFAATILATILRYRKKGR